MRSLGLPESFGVTALVDCVAAARGKPIVLWCIVGQPAPCGLWVASPTRDYIFYEGDTSPLHQAHIILHELAHVVLGHHSARVGDAQLLQSLLPHLDVRVLQTVLRRARYDTEQEQEAELLASLLLARLAPSEPVPPPLNPAAQVALDRLGSSLERQDSLGL